MFGVFHGGTLQNFSVALPEEGASSLGTNFSYGIRLDHETVKRNPGAAGHDWDRPNLGFYREGSKMLVNSSCNTFNNDRKRGSVKWPHLPDREE